MSQHLVHPLDKLSLSAHTQPVVRPPSLFVRFPKQAGRHPLGGSVRLHIGETFPKAFPVLLASQQAVTFLPSCVFHKHTRGPKGSRGQRCPFVDMLDWGWGGGRTRSGRDTGAVHRVCATCGDYMTAFHAGPRSFQCGLTGCQV